MSLSPADLATQSLLDPDQGVCPDGHECQAANPVGIRSCSTCGYRGLGLICWEISPEEIITAERAGAAPSAIAWARLFRADRD